MRFGGIREGKEIQHADWTVREGFNSIRAAFFLIGVGGLAKRSVG
jgi:hypothetical protein